VKCEPALHLHRRIHGCYDELVELLSLAAVATDDVVVALGDLTRKGPAPDRCVELWLARRYLARPGDNDAKMLARSGRWMSRLIAGTSDRGILRPSGSARCNQEVASVYRLRATRCRRRSWRRASEFHKVFSDLVPREAALELRYIRRNGEWRMIRGARSRRRSVLGRGLERESESGVRPHAAARAEDRSQGDWNRYRLRLRRETDGGDLHARG